MCQAPERACLETSRMKRKGVRWGGDPDGQDNGDDSLEVRAVLVEDKCEGERYGSNNNHEYEGGESSSDTPDNG